MMGFSEVGKIEDFLEGKGHIVELKGKRLALFRIGENFFALSNVCAHQEGPLSGGKIKELNGKPFVECPWHKYEYCLFDGKGPGQFEDSVDSFEVKIEKGKVFVSNNPKIKGKENELVKKANEQLVTGSLKEKSELFCLVCGTLFAMNSEKCMVCKAPKRIATDKKPASQEEVFEIEEDAVIEYLEKGLKELKFAQPRIQMWKNIAKQKPIDVLIVSASANKAHIVNGFIVPNILKHIKQTHPGLHVEWVDLLDFKIDHNWACYSLEDDYCRFPCNNMLDDAKKIYPKIVRAKSLIIVTPINWEGMNSRLKVFLDRLTNLQDIALKTGKSDFAGRPVAIFVNGHEDGAYKVAWDVFVIFQNMGYILAPFGIWYNLQSLSMNTKEDLQAIKNNNLAIDRMKKVADNLIETMELRIDKLFKGRPEGEKLRYVAM